MNGQKMCMEIAEHWLKTNSPNLQLFPGYEKESVWRLAERIWYHSPTGELFNVFIWYYEIVGYPPGFWDIAPPANRVGVEDVKE